ncbi:hypothetical protein DYBT9275_05682 [Dyadobacter sp. CECT 9275]|uniref:Uncharacterized protein n=1 Tax=Dyadobacter helix TaxID=2822344 RepID=A0A916JI07_9BACT|nr:hypothetical protein DYBT9275_05682 [Dyadobacter sp. CECT 9275]
MCFGNVIVAADCGILNKDIGMTNGNLKILNEGDIYQSRGGRILSSRPPYQNNLRLSVGI